MLSFLANIIEQIDLASEHVSIRDATNARFGLMLIDNAVEITLHQIAKDEQIKLRTFSYREKPYEHASALQDALGQHFDAKLKFAAKTGKLKAQDSQTLGLFHAFRNEVYHIGVQHEAVLPAVAEFSLKVSCEFLSTYSPSWMSYSLGMKLPDRASKYFSDQKFYSNGIEEYQAACKAIGKKVKITPAALANTLADHLDQVIEEQDTAISVISGDGPRKQSRNEAIINTFSWKIASSEEGKDFARKNNCKPGSVFDLVNWIGENYPLPIRGDPIKSWKARAASVQREKDPHKALKKYRDFMTQTAEIRAALDEAHMQVDQYIQNQIDRARGK
jgi:hypothetical protein